MPLPAGITTCTVSYGAALNAIGEGGGVITDPKVTASDRMVWSATGDTLFETYVPAIQHGNTVTFDVPHVDQAGFIASANGEPHTMWVYKFTCRVRVGDVSYPVSKTFQPTNGQATLDLDRLPDGGASPAALAPPGTTDALITAIDADAASAFRVQQDARLDARGPVSINVRKYGIRPTNTAAANDPGMAALFAEHAGAVSLAFPEAGIYRFGAPLPDRNGLSVRGAGHKRTTLRWESTPMLAPTVTLTGLYFADTALDTPNSTGTHLVNLSNGGGLVHTTFERCDLRARPAAASIVHALSVINLFGICWRDCYMWRTPGDTVPAINVTAGGSGVNNVSWQGGQLHAQNITGAGPFIRMESLSPSFYIGNITLHEVVGEQNKGGIFHGFGINGLDVQNVLDYDASTYTDSLFLVGTAATGAESDGARIDQAGTAAASTFPAGRGHVEITGNGIYHRLGRIANATSSPVLAIPKRGVQHTNEAAVVPAFQVLTAGQALSRFQHTVVVTGSGQTATLPAATSQMQGREFVVKATHSTGLTVASAGGTIDGAATLALTQWQYARFVTDGANWFRVG